MYGICIYIHGRELRKLGVILWEAPHNKDPSTLGSTLGGFVWE